MLIQASKQKIIFILFYFFYDQAKKQYFLNIFLIKINNKIIFIKILYIKMLMLIQASKQKNYFILFYFILFYFFMTKQKNNNF